MTSTLSSRRLHSHPAEPTSGQVSAKASDGNIVALLSLKLMLLAFFLLLVSLSSLQEQKVELVIESVNDVFDGKIKSQRSLPVFESALEELKGAEEATQVVARLFAQYLPASRVDPLDEGRRLRIALDLDRFFADGEARFRVGPGLLLDRLSGLLQDNEALSGVRIAAQQAYPEGAGEEAVALAARRMAVLARAFVKRGLSPERVSAGFSDVPPGDFWVVIDNIDG